jgi:hypothetical protein
VVMEMLMLMPTQLITFEISFILIVVTRFIQLKRVMIRRSEAWNV